MLLACVTVETPIGLLYSPPPSREEIRECAAAVPPERARNKIFVTSGVLLWLAGQPDDEPVAAPNLDVVTIW